jgi:hypothetical protein
MEGCGKFSDVVQYLCSRSVLCFTISHGASMFLLPLELVYDRESQGGVVRRIFLLASDQEIFFMECLHF